MQRLINGMDDKPFHPFLRKYYSNVYGFFFICALLHFQLNVYIIYL